MPRVTGRRRACPLAHSTLFLSPHTPNTAPRRDIEGSTGLWEVLDESVMDLAIKMHHACVRKCITACAGYEAQVEGDSFTVAFHDANDAVHFCIELQVRTQLVMVGHRREPAV